MILLLATALVAFSTNSFLIWMVFYLATQAAWLAILYNSIGVPDDFGYGFIFSFFVGFAFFAYRNGILPKKSAETARTINRRVTLGLFVMFCTALVASGYVYYLGVQQGQRYLEEARQKQIQLNGHSEY